ncbi:MAG: hypothetical protein IT261_03825 [Saprospiraceae bacterium]|nr:hypothetical protein [Saprospiraceae bacterium]
MHSLQAELATLTQQQVVDTPDLTHERVVILDTIYQTLVIQRQLYSSAEIQSHDRTVVQYNPVSNSAQAISSTASNSSNIPATKAAITSKPDTTQAQSVVATENEIKAPHEESVFEEKVDSVLNKMISTDDIQPVETPLVNGSVQTNRIKPERKKLRYHFGLGGGGLHVLNSREDKAPAAWLAQCQGEVLWGKHWSLSTSLSFIGQSLELNHPADPRWMLNLPASPSPDYSFQHLEGSLQYWLPAIQLKYYLRPDRNWNWYLGSGYAARIFMSNELETEYFDPGSNQEIKVEADQKIPLRNLNVTSQIGLSWQPKKLRWQVFMDGNGVFDVGKGQRTFPLGFIQAGIKWGTR